MRALNDYEGAVILISHDRHLIDACADRLWIVRGGTVRAYDGDMDQLPRRMPGRAHHRRRNSRPLEDPQDQVAATQSAATCRSAAGGPCTVEEGSGQGAA